MTILNRFPFDRYERFPFERYGRFLFDRYVRFPFDRYERFPLGATINYHNDNEHETEKDSETKSDLYGLRRLLKDYIDVYFSSATEFNLINEFCIPIDLRVDFSEDVKINLLVNLIEESFAAVDSCGSGGVMYSTLNKERDVQDSMGPGRNTLKPVFENVIDSFSKTITAEFDIKDCVNKCKDMIEDLFKLVQNKCELKTYTI